MILNGSHVVSIWVDVIVFFHGFNFGTDVLSHDFDLRIHV